MIRFDFKVTDAEAEAILDCVTNETLRCVEHSKDNAYSPAEQQWFKQRALFLIALKDKMKNCHEEE